MVSQFGGGKEEDSMDQMRTSTGPMVAPPRPDRNGADRGRGDVSSTARVLGIVAMVATFVPPGLFAAPVLGVLAIVFGAVGLSQDRRSGRPIDRAVLGIVLGAVSLATSLAGIWLFRHVIARAIADATAPHIG
jgi:hypothetical protein